MLHSNPQPECWSCVYVYSLSTDAFSQDLAESLMPQPSPLQVGPAKRRTHRTHLTGKERWHFQDKWQTSGKICPASGQSANPPGTHLHSSQVLGVWHRLKVICEELLIHCKRHLEAAAFDFVPGVRNGPRCSFHLQGG